MMDRRQMLLSMFDPNGFGLEIGPGYSPFLPKSAGYRVETIDYTDQAGLIRKYKDNPTVDINQIEPVDFVSDGGRISDIISKRACYDFIFASHVIEHVPNLIEFLDSCSKLLKRDGVLILAVPDKRCCFDLYQPLTMMGEVLEAHLRSRTRPSYSSVFNEVAYGVVQDGQSGWPLGHDGRRELVASLTAATTVADSAEKGTYHDVHVWRFVPSSFQLLMNDLRELGMIDLGIASIEGENELLVKMTREGRGTGRTRLELLDATLHELAEGVSRSAVAEQSAVP